MKERLAPFLVIAVIVLSAFIPFVFAAGSASYEFSATDVTNITINVIPGQTIVIGGVSWRCTAAGTAAQPTVSDSWGSTFTSTFDTGQSSYTASGCTGASARWDTWGFIGLAQGPAGNTGTLAQPDKISFSGGDDYWRVIVLVYSSIAAPFVDSNGGKTATGTSTTPALGAGFTPDANYYVIEFVSWCRTSTGTATPAAANGFTLSTASITQSAICNSANVGEPGLRGATHQLSTSTTCNGITLSASSPWHEGCFAVPTSGTASLPIVCTIPNGGADATITLSQSANVGSTTHAPEPATFTCSNGLGKLFWTSVSTTSGNTITATVPTDGTNTRYRYQVSSAESTTTTYATNSNCLNANWCKSWPQILYEEVKNDFKMQTGVGTWEANHNGYLHYSAVGLSATKTFSLVSGGTSTTNKVWTDYNVGAVCEPTDGVAGVRWVSTSVSGGPGQGNTGSEIAAATTGGNTITCSFQIEYDTQTTTTQTTTTQTTTSTSVTSTTTTTTTSSSGGGEPANLLWLLLIPLFVVVFWMLKKRL